MELSMTAGWRALRRTVAGPDYPPPRPLERWPRLRGYAGPAGLVLVVAAFGGAVAEEVERGLPPAVVGGFAVLTVAPLVLLSRRPLLAWRVAVVALLTCTFNAPRDAAWPWTTVLLLVAAVALLAVAVRADRGVLAWVGGITALPILFLVRDTSLAVLLGLVAAALGVGDLVRRGRLAARALAEQTELGELERARRAVLEERTRIARELHDVVAHSMSMIAVRAETAPYRLAELPAPVHSEFTAIAGSARSALTDMRRLLGVLRSESGTPETAPQPGLADLADLLAAARRAGLAIVLTDPLPGPAADAPGPDRGSEPPAAVQLAAYRIVQEAVANAARHAPGGAVRVSVRAGGRALAIRVENDVVAGPPAADQRSPGHGLTGMRERAALLGGRLTAEPTPAGFLVTATLPYQPEDGDG